MNNPQGRAGLTGTLSVTKAILYGTLVAGALDATDGVVFFGLQG